MFTLDLVALTSSAERVAITKRNRARQLAIGELLNGIRRTPGYGSKGDAQLMEDRFFRRPTVMASSGRGRGIPMQSGRSSDGL